MMEALRKARMKALRSTSSERDEKLAYILFAFARLPMAFMLTVFLSPYATTLAKQAAGPDGRVVFFGTSIYPVSLVSAYSFIYSIISMTMCPITGAIADSSPYRKTLVSIVSIVNVVTLLMTMVVGFTASWRLAALIFVVSMVSQDASAALLNAYLPEIAHNDEQRSRLSTLALCYGNIAQVLLVFLMGMLIFYTSPGNVKLIGGTLRSASDAEKWCFQQSPSISDQPSFTENFVCSRDNAEDVFSFQSPTVMGLFSFNKFVELKGEQQCASVYQRVDTHEDQLSNFEFQFSALRKKFRNDESASSSRLRVWMSDDRSAPESSQLLCESGKEPLLPELSLQKLTCTVPDTSTLDSLLFEFAVCSDSSAPVRASLHQFDAFGAANNWNAVAVVVSGIWLLAGFCLAIRKLGSRTAAHVTDYHMLSVVSNAFLSLFRTLGRTRHNPQLWRFLLAQALFTAGAGAMVSMTSTFFQETMNLPISYIAGILLAVQLIAIAGAFFFHMIGQRIGFGRSLCLSYAVWIVDIALTAVMLRGPENKFYIIILAPLTGVAMGSALSLSRAVFARMVPLGSEAELYGLFAFAQVCLGPIGTFLFAFVQEATGNMNAAISSELLLLVPAFLLQCTVEEPDNLHDSQERELEQSIAVGVRETLASIEEKPPANAEVGDDVEATSEI